MKVDVYFSSLGRENIIETALGVSSDKLMRAPTGKPYLENGREFNLSDCDGIYVCAVSDVPVGVDIEKIKPRRLDMISKFFHVDELARLHDVPQGEYAVEFYRMWTLKEAYSKLRATGISKQLLNEINTLNLRVCHETAHYCGEYIISVCCAEDAEIVFHEQVERI